MDTFTLRVPLGWGRSLDSPRVRAWLADYLRQPGPLPADPGPGDARVSLSLPRRPVRVLSALLDCSHSAALRRLVASQPLALPAPVRSLPPEAAPVALARPLALRPSSRPGGRVVLYPWADPALCPKRQAEIWEDHQRTLALEASTGIPIRALTTTARKVPWVPILVFGLFLSGFFVPLLLGKAAPVAAGPLFVPWMPVR